MSFRTSYINLFFGSLTGDREFVALSSDLELIEKVEILANGVLNYCRFCPNNCQQEFAQIIRFKLLSFLSYP